MSGHITAGDVSPLFAKRESSYGVTPSGDWDYYADIKGDGGNFTPTDNPQQYVSWRGGNRSYAQGNLLFQNVEAGYTAIWETGGRREAELLEYALGSPTGTTPLGTLPSRTSAIWAKTVAHGAKDYDRLIYPGCKTDRLVIKADQPGGIVEFQETVMAKDVYYGVDTTSTVPTAPDTRFAVQWMGGIGFDVDRTFYPQNFELSINNNLARVKGLYTAEGEGVRAATVGLVEGRREMELSFDLWMEDLEEYYAGNGVQSGVALSETLSLNIGNQWGYYKLTCVGNRLLDGNNHALIQDKQLATLRFRVASIAVEYVNDSPSTQA